MVKRLNRKVVGVVSAIIFGIIAICLVSAFSLNRAKVEAAADANSDDRPTVSMQKVSGAENYVEIKITSHNNQVTSPQTFNKEEMYKAFKIINDDRYRYRACFEDINGGTNVHLIVDKYAKVGGTTINKTNLNEAFNFINDGTNDKPSYLVDFDKVVISEIDFVNAALKDVTFDGTEAVSNVPGCKTIKIESPTFCDNCINHLPNLEYVYINNRSSGFTNKDLNKAMNYLGDQVVCDVHRDLGSNLKFEFIPNYIVQDTRPGEGRPGEWSSIEQNVDTNPGTVSFNSKTGQTTIKSSTNSNDFGFVTLKAAFANIEQSNATNAAFWNDVSQLENISLRIEVYGGYTANAISQDAIKQVTEKWATHVDKLKNNPLKLASVELICQTECQIYFRGPFCIHDCPHLTNVLVERANFPSGSSPSIYNCPKLSNIRIDNRSQRWDDYQFNPWIQKVAPGCHLFLHRVFWWPNVDYYYSYDGVSPTGTWHEKE